MDSQRAISAFHCSIWDLSFCTYSSRFIMAPSSGKAILAPLLQERRIEPLGVLVALAGHRFETLAVEDAHLAAAVIDDAVGFQLARRLAHARARRGEHRREHFVRQKKLALPGKVVHEEEPARHALHDGVKRVARHGAAPKGQAKSRVAQKGP